MRYLIFCLFFSVSCVPTAPVEHPVERTKSVHADADATWTSLVDIFAEEMWPIQTLDKASGLIATDWLKADERFADCGGSGIATTGPIMVRFNVRVKPQSDTTSVTINTQFRQVRSFGSSSSTVDCTSRGTAESMIHEKLMMSAGGDPGSAAR